MNTDKQNTEAKILAAAETEFLKKGYDAARTTAIAKNAGVTHAMVNYYFRSKENLFDRVISEKTSSLGEVMLYSLTKSDLPLFEKIKMAVSSHLDFIHENQDLPNFLIREVFMNPERIKTISNALRNNAKASISNLQMEIDAAAERGECRRLNAEMLLLDILSLNVFSFLAQPVIETVFQDLMSNRKLFVEQRKIENYETILRKLKI